MIKSTLLQMVISMNPRSEILRAHVYMQIPGSAIVLGYEIRISDQTQQQNGLCERDV